MIALAFAALVACRHAPPPAEAVRAPIGESIAPRDILLQGADDLSPTVRGPALAALIATEVDPAPWVRRGLVDPDPDVARLAAKAAASRGTLAPVTKWLSEGLGDPSVRGVAARLAGEAARAPIAATWKRDTDPWARLPMALAAAHLDLPDARNDVARSVSQGVIPWDQDLLADLGDVAWPELIDALAQATRTAEPDVALDLAVASLALGDTRGETVLRKALTDPDPLVRLGVVDRTQHLPDPAGSVLLRRAIAEGPPTVAAIADIVLRARSEDSRALPDALAHDDSDVRAEAARAAGAIARPNKTVVRALVDALDDPEVTVRRHVAAACRSCPADDLRTRLADDDATVRIAAARTLLMGPAP